MGFVRRWSKPHSSLNPVMELQDASGFTLGVDYCGVTAIAALTGLHCKAVTEAVQHMRGSFKPVVGMMDFEIANTLGYLGYRVDLFLIRPAPRTRVTLRRFWHDRGDMPASLVVLRGHYVALDNALIVDTNTGGKPDFVDGHAYAKCGVLSYMEVRKL